MTCSGGCPTHLANQADPPTAADDPCNSSGNGFFCVGSWWHQTTACGDFLYKRIGENCNMANQWLKIPVPTTRNETIPPVNGQDCCPAGSMWIVPTGTNGSLVDQVWVSTGDETCTWEKIAGFTNVLARIAMGDTIALVNGLNDFPATEIVGDILNEGAIVGQTFQFTAQETGKYIVNMAIVGDQADNTPAGNLGIVAGIEIDNVNNGYPIILSTGLSHPFGYGTFAARGSRTIFMAAGQVATFIVSHFITDNPTLTYRPVLTEISIDGVKI